MLNLSMISLREVYSLSFLGDTPSTIPLYQQFQVCHGCEQKQLRGDYFCRSVHIFHNL
jgi:hypothetical protein